MIFGYTKNGEYKEIKEISAGYLWFDLVSPTQEIEQQLEKLLGIDIPTREEMAEIELSNRIYEENGAHYLTAIIVTSADTDEPKNEAVTFIISKTALITLRYHEMGAFKQYIGRLPKSLPQTHTQIFLGLVESAVNRIADILERIGADIDNASRKVFKDKASKNRYEVALHQVGISGDLISKSRESLITFSRVLTYCGGLLNADDKNQAEILQKDIAALGVHADFLSNKAMFLLDATLGMINFEQNNIIKIFTLAALIFLPPTLIAGVYGMNFHSMPELGWHYGYPFALFLMFISAFLPYRYFKKKGWI